MRVRLGRIIRDLVEVLSLPFSLIFHSSPLPPLLLSLLPATTWKWRAVNFSSPTAFGSTGTLQHWRCWFSKNPTSLQVSKNQLGWFIAAISNLDQYEEHRFFLKNGREADGTTRLIKFRAPSQWTVRCVTRNSSGFQSFVHVYSWGEKQGWFFFLQMLKSFLMNHNYGLWHSSLQPASRSHGSKLN